MGKILTWVAIAAIVYLAWRVLLASRRRVERSRRESEADAPSGASERKPARPDRADDARAAPEPMMRCAVCGLHLPGSEAVFARGRVYCGAEHRDQDAVAADAAATDAAATDDAAKDDAAKDDAAKDAAGRPSGDERHGR